LEFSFVRHIMVLQILGHVFDYLYFMLMDMYRILR
jgi:hypothetical protein